MHAPPKAADVPVIKTSDLPHADGVSPGSLQCHQRHPGTGPGGPGGHPGPPGQRHAARPGPQLRAAALLPLDGLGVVEVQRARVEEADLLEAGNDEIKRKTVQVIIFLHSRRPPLYLAVSYFIKVIVMTISYQKLTI